MGGRRWRTVCTGYQELAGAVCSQIGYIFEGNTKIMYCGYNYLPTASAVAQPNSFLHGAFPEYRLDCTQLGNGAWHCSPVEQQCDSFVELGVVCKNYEDLYNDCSMNCTLPVATTQSSTTQQGKLINAVIRLSVQLYFTTSQQLLKGKRFVLTIQL